MTTLYIIVEQLPTKIRHIEYHTRKSTAEQQVKWNEENTMYEDVKYFIKQDYILIEKDD